ncbi:MAG: hypothetical protein CMI63_19965 [Parvularcula sp.]|nr:hypothetical protein [Parvularcula sp.]
MITIKTWSDLRAATETHPAREILCAHAGRLEEFRDQPLGELCEFILVEPTDTIAALETKLGRALDPPPWEYVDRSDGWYELVLVTGDDGFGYVVLVPNGNQALLDYCNSLTL